MLIVCTKDPDIVAWTNNPASGAGNWGNINVLANDQNQDQATAQLRNILAQLGPNEALCLSAHGNDDDIGDAGNGPNDWSWSRADIAALLTVIPGVYAGPILIRACAHNVANFSAGLALALEAIPALNNVWIYGYNVPVDINRVYPAPANMPNQADLQGAQVHYQ